MLIYAMLIFVYLILGSDCLAVESVSGCLLLHHNSALGGHNSS